MNARRIAGRGSRWLGLTALYVIAVALVIGAGATLASTVQIKDAQGDSKKGHADIKAVKVVGGGRAVVWTIEAYEGFPTPKAPCVGISFEAKRHPLGDNYEVCGDGALQDFKHGGTVGRATLKRPNDSTIVYRIGRGHFKHKKAIAWNVQVRDKGCQFLCDQAPEGPGAHVVQKL